MNADNKSAIRCAGLSRRYGAIQAVAGLDLEVPAGSVFGFLGRNGAGKTTAIRLLTGLAHPDSGRAWVNGVETTDGDSRAQAQFGYLPQDPAFYNWMTPRALLDYIGRLFMLSRAEREQRTAELLELVGLTKHAGRRIGSFSGGMKQRLGLAQALVHGPPVLILDEPMSGLDPAGRREFLALLEALREHVTVFFSSHILADVERVCDTVGILRDGRLVEVAEREALLARYETKTALLTFSRESADQLPVVVADLQNQPWVTEANLDEVRVRLTVGDADAGLRELLPLIVRHNLPLLRYEWLRPDLEEIFLALSEEQI